MNTVDTMCHNKIGPYAQIVDFIIALANNANGRPCETTPKERGYTLEVQDFRKNNDHSTII